MSYLAFDLDALKLVPDAARSAGLDEAVLGYGLVRLWSFCWTTRTEFVKPAHVRGFFGGDVDRVLEALVAFEFVAIADQGYRVRGADKYLRINQAQKGAGKAQAGNLRRGKGSSGGAGDTPPEPKPKPGPQPDPTRNPTREAVPALSPSTEHRTPSTEQEEVAPPPSTFFDAVQQKRRAAGAVVDEQRPDGLAGWLTALAREGVDDGALEVAYAEFSADPYWARKGAPFTAFMSQAREYLGRVRRRVPLVIIDGETREQVWPELGQVPA